MTPDPNTSAKGSQYNGRRVVIQLVVYTLLSAKKRACFYRSIPIERGGASRYFSKVSGSAVYVTFLNDLNCCELKIASGLDRSRDI